MMIDSYLSDILWTLFVFLKHVFTEHSIPYEVYHNYLFVDICVDICMSKLHQNTWSTFIWCKKNYINIMTMAQSRQVLYSTMGPLVVRFYVNFPKIIGRKHDVLYSYYLKPLLYTIDNCMVGRYIFLMIFNCLRICKHMCVCLHFLLRRR